MATDIAALNTQAKSWVDTLGISWSDLATVVRGKLAEFAITGAVTSYTINGRSVSMSISELRELLKICEARQRGGIIQQLGEFGREW